MSRISRNFSRAGGQPLLDPGVFACWRLVEAFPAKLRAVRVLAARSAPPDSTLDGHLHAEPTVVCCLAGVARIETGAGRIDLAAGEAAVVAPGAWHTHPPLRAGSAVFAQGTIGRRSDVVLATPERRWWVVVPEQPARELLARALGGAASERRTAVAELAAQFAREPATALAMSPDQAAMARFLWANFTRPISGAEIVRSSGLGRSQAHESFRACFGESPKRALTRCRLAMAARLDAEGLEPAEAAARSGFMTAARLGRARRTFRP
jgi:AraC-like DNA-binding protein